MCPVGAVGGVVEGDKGFSVCGLQVLDGSAEGEVQRGEIVGFDVPKTDGYAIN